MQCDSHMLLHTQHIMCFGICSDWNR